MTATGEICGVTAGAQDWRTNHSADSIKMGEWAANLILANVFATIDVKENVDSSTEGPEPEPPVDSEQKAAERSPTRPIPKPLQDDPTWAGHKEDEVLAPPKSQLSPEAQVLCWPQTPQSPVAPVHDTWNHYGYAWPGAWYPYYGHPQYNPYAPLSTYHWNSAGQYPYMAPPPAPAPGHSEMRQAYYPQGQASQPQWSQTGQAFFQPFSTQPPVHPAAQYMPPPPPAPVPAYPPMQQRAPLTAHFSPPPPQPQPGWVNTQPGAPFQQPVQPAAPAYQVPLRPPQHVPQVPQVPPQQSLRSPERPKPASPAHTKQERRQAAEEVLARQQAWVALLQRQGNEGDRPSEASTAVTTPAGVGVVASSSESKNVKEEMKTRSWADENEEKPSESKGCGTPGSSMTPVPATEESRPRKELKEAWAPSIARGWKSEGSKGAWVVKDQDTGKNAKKSYKGSGKGQKGKGGKGLVYRPKGVIAEAEVPTRQPETKVMGRMGERNSTEPIHQQAQQAKGRGRGRRGRGKN